MQEYAEICRNLRESYGINFIGNHMKPSSHIITFPPEYYKTYCYVLNIYIIAWVCTMLNTLEKISGIIWILLEFLGTDPHRKPRQSKTHLQHSARTPQTTGDCLQNVTRVIHCKHRMIRRLPNHCSEMKKGQLEGCRMCDQITKHRQVTVLGE